MQIRRLKLTGFKSFVDPTELRIETGLTGIVGPNGCGKSNLLEAIRWVMGESSPKSMRGGGMEDVIFAGTADRPERGFAEVSLLAQRQADDAAAQLPGVDPVSGEYQDSEIEVVRRIERGAGSAYRANGRDVRAKDIALIFADAATGAHSPALVSQGRIGAIISAKPAERRQMLEEAAGIAGLHVRRKDAEQKLRAAETNLSRLDDILRDTDARAGQLRRQARAAERYRKLSDGIATAEARLIYSRWRDAAAAADAAKQEAEEARKRVEAAQSEMQAMRGAQEDATSKVAEARSALQAQRDAQGEIARELATLSEKLENTKARLADLDRQSTRLTEDSNREDRLTHDAANALGALEKEAADIARKLAAMEAERPELERDHDRAERATRESEVALAKANAEVARMEADARVASAALNAARSRTDRLNGELARIHAQMDEQPDTDSLQRERVEAQAARDEAAQSVSTARSALQQLEEQRDTAIALRDTAESELSSARADHAALDRELDALERDARQRTGKKQALDSIRVNTGYEAALAAALGDDIQAGLGLPGGEDKEGRYWAGSDQLQQGSRTIEGAERLCDHIADAPAELGARLARIWMAREDSGQKLLPGERLVTTDGNLRRWDGFIARGEGASAAERLARQNRLEELRSTAPKAEVHAQEAAQHLQNARDELAAIQARIGQAGQAIKTALERERASLRGLDSAEYAITRQAERRAELDTQRADLCEELDAATHERAQAESQHAELPDAAKTTSDAATLEARNKAARQAMQAANAKLSSLDQSLSATRERKAVIRAEIKGWQARSSEAAQRIADMNTRLQQLAEERKVLEAKPEGLNRALAEKQAERETIAGKLAALDTAHEAVEEALKRHESQIADTSEALAVAREERAGADARAENQQQRRVEMGRISGERFECPPSQLPEKHAFDADAVAEPGDESAKLEKLVQDRERIGPVNLIAADELAETEAELHKGQAEHTELTEAINRLRGSIGSLNREGRQRLTQAFEEVDQHFRRLFETLFDGGQAHLAMVDSDDPLEAGLEIMAQPPGKRLTSLSLLSGGEQALTAVALIFALFLTNPAPICVLDEVDAPLDDANIERFCDLLDAMVKETATRYLIVTHNAVTMSRMHRLFGVTMVEKGISRLVSVDLGSAEELLAAE